MTEKKPLYNSVAPLRNVVSLVELIERVNGREIGLPGMASYYGPSGYGKTTACIFAANHFRAYQVQVKSCWTRKKLCQAILEDMAIEPSKTISDMVDQIAEHLTVTDKVLLVDEADHLVRQNMIELIRDIYESSGTTIILIGEEQLPKKLMQWERVHGRMLDWVAAEPATLDDVAHLAPIYAPDIEVAKEFQENILKAANHSVRRICINLARVQEWAKMNGKLLATTEDYSADGEGFFPSSAPAPRRLSA